MHNTNFLTFVIQIFVSNLLVRSFPLNQHISGDSNISVKAQNFSTRHNTIDNKHYNITVVSNLNVPNEQETEEFSSFWEKVYDDEVLKHEHEIKKHQHRHHEKKNAPKNEHKFNIKSQNFNQLEIKKDKAQKESLNGIDNHYLKNKFSNDKGINNDDNHASIKSLHKLTKLNTNKEQHTLKPIAFFQKNQNRKKNNKEDVDNISDPHANRAIVKMRSRHKFNHLKELNTPAETEDGKSRGAGKTRSHENSEQDRETQNNEEVRDFEDRKRLPRNAAWFVQAALRMCETGQDPRCKKISVRKGNVKISIKIAED